MDETPHLLNPASGWLYNSNNWPWSAAGPSSPKRADYPAYVESGTETARGLHAIRVLENTKNFTVDSLIAAAYDSYLTWFDKPLPALIKAWDGTPARSPLKSRLAEQIELLRKWDHRWAVNSVPTSLAVFWGEDIRRRVMADARKAGLSAEDYIGGEAPAEMLLQSLAAASDRLAVGLRDLEDSLGRYQPLPAPHRRHRPAVQRRGPEHPRGLHVFAVGIARFIRSAAVSGHEEVVRHQRQQLRGGGGVRPTVRAKAVTAGGESGHPESRISMMKRSATPPAISAKSISTVRSSRGTPSGSTIPEAKSVRYPVSMQTIQPDQADFLLHGVYLPSLRNEQGLTRKVIEAIPLEQGGYRPDEVSKSALDLAWHIAATEIRFMDAVAAGAFDFSPRPLPDSIRNSKDLAAWYSENFEPRFETLTKLSKEQLTKVVDFRGLFQLPAVMYLNFVLHHSIHHRGQLSTYLRPMGAKVPAIYGESYDSAAARKAAQ